MPADNEIKFRRIPVDKAECKGCKKPLPWGSWAYYQESTGIAMCTECAAKNRLEDKDIANLIVKKRELQEDLKALRTRLRIEADALYLLKEKVDVTRFGERYLDLERQIHALMDTVQDYLYKCAGPEEKAALQKVLQSIEETQELQKTVKDELEMRMYLIKRAERKGKHLEKLVDDEERKEAEEEDKNFNESMAQIKEEAAQS